MSCISKLLLARFGTLYHEIFPVCAPAHELGDYTDYPMELIEATPLNTAAGGEFYASASIYTNVKTVDTIVDGDSEPPESWRSTTSSSPPTASPHLMFTSTSALAISLSWISMLLLYAVIPSLAMVYTAICGLVLLGAMPRSQIIYHLGSILPTTFIWPSFRIGPGHTRFALSLSFALILALILLFSGVTAGTFGEKFYFFSAHNGTSGIRILLDSGATRSVFHTGCDLALITNVVRLKYPINVMGVNGTMPIQNLGTVTLHFLDDNSRMQTRR